jgi:hypothetical protein
MVWELVGAVRAGRIADINAPTALAASTAQARLSAPPGAAGSCLHAPVDEKHALTSGKNAANHLPTEVQRHGKRKPALAQQRGGSNLARGVVDAGGVGAAIHGHGGG